MPAAPAQTDTASVSVLATATFHSYGDGLTSAQLLLTDGFTLTARGTSVPLPAALQRLVAYLALQRGPVTRPRVSGVLWPDRNEKRAGANLRSLLFRFQTECPPEARPVVEITPDRLALAADVSCDVHRFVAYARALLASGQDAESFDLRLDLVPLANDLLPGWYDDWVLVERERLHQLRLHALDELCLRLSACGRHGEAVEAGLASVAAEPLRERGQACLISAHMGEGNRSEAAQQYRRYAAMLAEELHCAPSADLEALASRPFPSSPR